MCARLERRGGVRNSPSIWLCRATCQTPLLGAGLSQGTVLPTVGKQGPGDIHNRPNVRPTLISRQGDASPVPRFRSSCHLLSFKYKYTTEISDRNKWEHTVGANVPGSVGKQVTRVLVSHPGGQTIFTARCPYSRVVGLCDVLEEGLVVLHHVQRHHVCDVVAGVGAQLLQALVDVVHVVPDVVRVRAAPLTDYVPGGGWE